MVRSNHHAKKQGIPDIHATKAQLRRIATFDTSDYITLDCETTGLDTSTDEVLELAIVDNVGNILFNERFRPVNHTSWPEAQRKHHISPDAVKNEKPFSDYLLTVKEILESANLIVGYNLDYDLDILANSGLTVDNKRRFDLMLEYAPIYGEWADWKYDYKWMKLTDVARHYNYDYQPHSALSDAYATAHCYREFVCDCKSQTHKTTKTLITIAVILAFLIIITASQTISPSLLFLIIVVVLLVALLIKRKRK